MHFCIQKKIYLEMFFVSVVSFKNNKNKDTQSPSKIFPVPPKHTKMYKL